MVIYNMKKKELYKKRPENEMLNLACQLIGTPILFNGCCGDVERVILTDIKGVVYYDDLQLIRFGTTYPVEWHNTALLDYDEMTKFIKNNEKRGIKPRICDEKVLEYISYIKNSDFDNANNLLNTDKDLYEKIINSKNLVDNYFYEEKNKENKLKKWFYKLIKRECK